MAAEHGAEVIPVWNKSHREHTTIGSEPGSIRAAAEQRLKNSVGRNLITWTPITSALKPWMALSRPATSTPLT